MTSEAAGPDVRPGPLSLHGEASDIIGLRFFSSIDEEIQCCFPTLQHHLQHGSQYEREREPSAPDGETPGLSGREEPSRDPQAVGYDLYAVIDVGPTVP